MGRFISAQPSQAEMLAMAALISGSGSSGDSQPTCGEHEAGMVQIGWGPPENRNWNLQLTAARPYTLSADVLTTPTTTQAAAWTDPVSDHATTIRSYPDGFIIELDFGFDFNQIPIFPGTATGISGNKHRPTFLGNSGLGIYHWPGNEGGKYLYEIQITDNAGMCGNTTEPIIPHQNRFVRLDYGSDWTQK